MEDSTVTLNQRPGVLTFVGVLIYIKAVIAVVVGMALLLERNDSAVQSATGQTADALLAAAIVEFILAVLLFAVASGIMSGAKWSRLLVAIVVAIRLAVVTYWMITHLHGGLHLNALLSAAFALFVLWVLYGNEQSQKYFEGYA